MPGEQSYPRIPELHHARPVRIRQETAGMFETPNLKLPYIAPARAQKHVTHNEAIRRARRGWPNLMSASRSSSILLNCRGRMPSL